MKIFTIPESVNSDKPAQGTPYGNAYCESNPSGKEENLPTAEIDKNAGHRERLRGRFEKSGLGGFNDYEVLELLLTYSIPRKDTKDISKNLLKRFGSLKGILSADIQELKKIDGLGRQSVIFIKVLNEFIKFYFEQQAEMGEIQFTELEQMVTYLSAVIGSYKNEVVKVLYLDSQNKMIHKELIDAGTVNESYLNYRRIAATALRYSTTSVIIAHNHPDGDPEPSENDNIITQKIAEALKLVDIDLQDHIIIASEGFYSYRQQGIL